MTTLKKFAKDYNEAPYELQDFAEGASKVTDCPALANAANAYRKAREDFLSALEDQGIEIG
jgi:hypothetical protein